MKPKIDGTVFGAITIEGEKYERDIIIRLGGRVKKRKKRLSKAVYGTSHVISLGEAKHVRQKGAERLIVGAGSYLYALDARTGRPVPEFGSGGRIDLREGLGLGAAERSSLQRRWLA